MEFSLRLHDEVQAGDTAADPGAVDVSQPRKVENELPVSLGEQAVHRALQFLPFPPQHEASGQFQQRGLWRHLACFDSELNRLQSIGITQSPTSR